MICSIDLLEVYLIGKRDVLLICLTYCALGSSESNSAHTRIRRNAVNACSTVLTWIGSTVVNIYNNNNIRTAEEKLGFSLILGHIRKKNN